MEIGFGGDEKVGYFGRCFRRFKASIARFIEKPASVMKKVKKIGQDDPRRIVHSLKVGLALTMVSLFYYYSPLYNGFGVATMWAVLTVVVVFEYTVGATLGKGLNRAFATLLAGALGVGAHHLASFSGERGEPIILGAFVFLIAVSSTFARFFPGIKARYDYGVLIFILTFSLVAVSSYRVDELIELAHQRLSTIAIGSFACVIISICVCPVWAGEDLHMLLALNIEKLAKFLEGFGAEYFKREEGENGDAVEEKSFLEAYKSVLNSKSTEESLANFARWEPAHGRFRFRHPWNQYLKIGALARQCACSIDVLNSCISSKIQAPMEFREKIQYACTKISSESSRALAELASAIRTMTKPVAVATHVANAKTAAAELKTALKITSSDIAAILEILPVATIASLLVEVVTHTEKLADAVDELGCIANFKSPAQVTERTSSLHRASIKPLSDDVDVPHVLITVPGSMSDLPKNAGPQEPMKTRHMDV